MEGIEGGLAYLLPWEFSPAWTLTCLIAAVIYWRGLNRRRRGGKPEGVWRPFAFFLGIAAIYAATQTHYDYLAQYMFFIHRSQHLVLHHVAPFLIALAAPLPILAAGLPHRARNLPGTTLAVQTLRPGYRLLQQPMIAALLFVGLIYFWLIPQVHFDAMLSHRLYQLMNWSMLLDGLLFWWLVLDPRSPEKGGLGYGVRIIVLVSVVPPQILLGAYLTFSNNVLFDVYAVCGRAWPLAPMTDQRLGGLITWIPAAMMSLLAILVVIGRLLGKSSLLYRYR
ncbi:cytochrome c oxidase assembly protein [Halomonas sp. Bachu 37]|uniref:cytochrome c oxidase assembly protein n=1 Tax=Halomonas kashgarensis TaxID=3084920 RepID=UPI003217F9B1